MCAWGFHWFPWGQHLQRKKANFGCVLIQCCQKRTLFYPDTIYAELKCYPPLSPLKIERIWSTMLLCVLALSWYWLFGGFPVDVPNSQQWFVTNCHNGPKDMSRFGGSNNWYWQKHFPGQFVGPRPLHSIACSRIRFLFYAEISLCHTKSWKGLQWLQPSLAVHVRLIDFSCME